jgi:hypothetical protein
MSAATPTTKTSRRLLPVDPYFAIMLAVKALCQASLSPVVLYFTDVRGLLHKRHWAEICFNPLNAKLNPICHFLALLAHPVFHVSRIRVNLMMSKPNPIKSLGNILDWSSDRNLVGNCICEPI